MDLPTIEELRSVFTTWRRDMGLSYRSVADAMAKAGEPIHWTCIEKFEKGEMGLRYGRARALIHLIRENRERCSA